MVGLEQVLGLFFQVIQVGMGGQGWRQKNPLSQLPVVCDDRWKEGALEKQRSRRNQVGSTLSADRGVLERLIFNLGKSITSVKDNRGGSPPAHPNSTLLPSAPSEQHSRQQ
jgi:hypothetical protein